MIDYEVICDSSDREKWLAARQSGIGASEAAAVLGISRWSSRLEVAADKVGLVANTDNEFMAAGRRLEPFIAEWALEEMQASDLQVEARPRGGMPCGLLLRSNKFPYMLATPDWWITEDGVEYPFQIKNTMRTGDWNEGVPEDVNAQLQHEMIVTGAPHCYCAVLLTGNRLRWFKVMAEPAFQDSHVMACDEFWTAIQTGGEIQTDSSESCSRALSLLHPNDNGLTLKLGNEALSIANDIDEYGQQAKLMNDAKRGAANALRALLGNFTYGELPDGTSLSCKTQKRKEHTVKASEFRVLRRLKK